MTENNTPPKVVVIGGGYSGTLAANRLRMRGDWPMPDVTLLNARPAFVERIRLHQVAAGEYDAAVDYRTLLSEGVRLVVDTATRIDWRARAVHLASGPALDYDYLVYAVGSTAAAPPSVPGVGEFAYPVAELEHAQRLRERLDTLGPDAPVTVVGGGLTGIEVAAELAEQGRHVTLVCGGQLGPALSERGRRSVGRALARLGVVVLAADTVVAVRPDAVVFADGAVRPTAVTVWAAGFAVPQLAAASGLSTDTIGRLRTDETLTSVDDCRIVAAGDCAAPSTGPLRMCCASASQLGPQAADTVLRRIAGTQPVAARSRFLGNSCTSVGRRGGILQFGRSDETPLNLYLGGRLAAAFKEAVCKGTLWGLRQQARRPESADWVTAGSS
ncbi:FAD-dependent oxidoreductase [Mycolicibacterium duvalii]|uniref:Dehydrogenase n=1 Tax=Mycolicibacterium duvalii TaxID=39688 RepID=A0A7I7KAU2_9MYCO|nr:FAD-dependent oxidoreductase [Mycolicibacterium duvalii]MCV7368380.1 FAD-dependent oxidoreductase [Mycolicibacterium duvalii]PEG41813.1 FAD-dependent oxidoreductase [Mycolicibacterium duvalii]BBX20482.1 dehydrogenase [Mycolicibacterium duvalii]